VSWGVAFERPEVQLQRHTQQAVVAGPMVHTTKDVAVAHPPHGAARDQNIVLDIPVFSSGTLPRCQMRMVVLEEGVGVLEVEGCGQIKQAGTIV